jgi:hypothetical protein
VLGLGVRKQLVSLWDFRTERLPCHCLALVVSARAREEEMRVSGLFRIFLVTFIFALLWNEARLPPRVMGEAPGTVAQAPDSNRTASESSAGGSELETLSTDEEDAAFTILQISDLHLDYRRADAVENLRVVLFDAIPRIMPDAVIVTGDITNAKRRRGLGHLSQQFVEEWSQYAEAVHQARVQGVIPLETTWIDLPGNHDMFGVLHRSRPHYNFYAQYCQLHIPGENVSCLQPRLNLFSFRDGRIAVLRVDAVPEPSLHRPLNFFGELSLDPQNENSVPTLYELPEGSNPAFVFVAAHYPSSFIDFKPSVVHSFSSAGGQPRVIYLSGHLHTLMGLCPHLYSSASGRFLDLELADLRYHRRLRMIYVDHANDEFGFQDCSLQMGSETTIGKVPSWIIVWLRVPTSRSVDGKVSSKDAPMSSTIKFVMWFLDPVCSFPDFAVAIDGVDYGRLTRRCSPQKRRCLYTLEVGRISSKRKVGIHVSIWRINSASDQPVCGPETLSETLHPTEGPEHYPILFAKRSSLLCRSVLSMNMPRWFRTATLTAGALNIMLLLMILMIVRQRQCKVEQSLATMGNRPSSRRLMMRIRFLDHYGRRSCEILLFATVWLLLGPWIVTDRITDNVWGVAFTWSTYVQQYGWSSPVADIFWLYGIQATALLMMYSLNLLVMLFFEWRMHTQVSAKVQIPRKYLLRMSSMLTGVIALLVHFNNISSLQGAFGLFGSFASPMGVPFMLLSSSLFLRSWRYRNNIIRNASIEGRGR